MALRAETEWNLPLCWPIEKNLSLLGEMCRREQEGVVAALFMDVCEQFPFACSWIEFRRPVKARAV